MNPPKPTYSATIDGKTYNSSNKEWLEEKFKNSNDYKRELQIAKEEKAMEMGAIVAL